MSTVTPKKKRSKRGRRDDKKRSRKERRRDHRKPADQERHEEQNVSDGLLAEMDFGETPSRTRTSSSFNVSNNNQTPSPTDNSRLETPHALST